MVLMLLLYLFVDYISCELEFQEIIDLTKQSAKKYKALSDENVINDKNYIKMPGIYHEKDVIYNLNTPVFGTDSPIVKGFYLKGDIFGIIPSNHEKFNKIINSFAVVDKNTSIIYKMRQLLSQIDDVYIFSVQKTPLTSIYDLTFVDLTTPYFEAEYPDVGIKMNFEVKADKSTKTNKIYISIGFCYDIDRKEKYTLDNIEKFDWPFIKSIGNKWNDLLKYLIMGMRVDVEIEMGGFDYGKLEITTNIVGGVGFSVEVDKILEEIFDKKRWDIQTIPYIKSKVIKFDYFDLGLECGLRLSTFLEDVTLSLPKIRLIGGIHIRTKYSMNYNFRENNSITNFRELEKHYELLKSVPSASQIINMIYVTFTLTPSFIPLYFQIDIPLVIHGLFEARVDYPFIFTFTGNKDCTKLVDFELDSKARFALYYEFSFVNYANTNGSFNIELFNYDNLIKTCITDYTNEYKEAVLKNAQDHDNFQIDDPSKPVEIPFQYFKFSTDDLAGKSYTATFTEPYEDGKLDVQIGLTDGRDCNRLIFSIKNGYILPEIATKLEGEDIYIIKATSKIDTTDYNFYIQINFKRYKKQNVVFHFYNIYALYENNGNYICPTTFPVKDLSYFNNVGCIGTESTPLMMQCCNDCTYNFCYEPVKKEKITDKYYVLNMISDIIFHANGNPYWVPEYHTFPNNTESFEIAADEYVYVPRVKCDRCDSVQFIVDDKMYQSKRWAKTNLFSPNIPTNGYDYDPDIDIDDAFDIDFELNSLKGFSNQKIKVIAICNDDDKSYCYSKCIEPEGYSVIEMNNSNGIDVYSGDIAKELPKNIYERGSKYQVINNEEIPKNTYCSKSWEGKIKVIPNLPKNKITLSIIDNKNKTKTIRAYHGNTYIPFSRRKLYSNPIKYLQDLGIAVLENDGALLESNENTNIFYAYLNFNGSVLVNSDYFNESNLIVGEDNIIISSSYITSVEIIHNEFVPKETQTNNKNKTTTIIIICCVAGALLIIIVIVVVAVVIHNKKKKKVSAESA